MAEDSVSRTAVPDLVADRSPTQPCRQLERCSLSPASEKLQVPDCMIAAELEEHARGGAGVVIADAHGASRLPENRDLIGRADELEDVSVNKEHGHALV